MSKMAQMKRKNAQAQGQSSQPSGLAASSSSGSTASSSSSSAAKNANIAALVAAKRSALAAAATSSSSNGSKSKPSVKADQHLDLTETPIAPADHVDIPTDAAFRQRISQATNTVSIDDPFAELKDSNARNQKTMTTSSSSHVVPLFPISSSEWLSESVSATLSLSPEAAASKAAIIHSSALQTAIAPGKQLLMTAFMLWMSGSSLQIFSIMMLCMSFVQPLQKAVNVQTEFKRYENQSLNLLPLKLLFLACNAAGIGLALYKSATMGLLPTSQGDWVKDVIRPVKEFSQH